jgi:hypothetical protein
VVIRDGSGCEFKMSGGRITLSAPGDVWLQPGRNLNVYAGDDIVLKAKQSIDITATDKDVRVKAENNLEMLAANSGTGRMLLENRATSSAHPDEVKTGEDIQGTGIILRARQSQIITMARDIFIRTGGSQNSRSISQGNIYIDAARGQQDIVCTSRFFTRELAQGAIDSFPVDGDKQTVNFYGPTNTQLMTALQLKGGLIITEADNGSKGILVEGQINVVNGHVATTDTATRTTAEADFGRLGALKEKSLADSQKVLEEVRTNMQNSAENETEATQFRTDNLYTELNQPGSDAFQEATEFSLRTAQQMRTTNFKLIENYWQQLARAAGEPPGTWTEKVVEYQSQEMLPHPGREAWRDQPTWQTQLPTFNLDTGREQNRVRNIYEEGTIEPFQAVIPDGNYPVISN